MKIGVLVSGGGTNLQNIIDAIESGVIDDSEIVTVVSSKEGVYALERANKHNIPNITISRKNFSSLDEFDEAICNHMLEYKVDLIVMAGFLSIVGNKLLSKFENRIINVHPSLIPAFCGQGYYGLKVHEEALARGVKITGATAHFVNNIPDGGPIITQKAVKVKEGDTPESLQLRVMQEAEKEVLIEAINKFRKGWNL